MPATIDTDGVLEQTAVESRSEVENLEKLQADRRALVQKFAPLAAKFRGGAVAGSDAARKRHRALVAKRILLDYKDATKQPAETALERMANADIEHIAFCDKLEADFTRYVLLENDIADITERIRNREECLRVYRAEIGLAR